MEYLQLPILLKMWGCMDSNHGPPRYKLGALTAELHPQITNCIVRF